MPTSRRCHECGRRLTDVLFCPRCGEWFCCSACLAQDKAWHLRLNATRGGPSKPAGTNRSAQRAPNTQAEIESQGTDTVVCVCSGRAGSQEILIRQKRFQAVQDAPAW